jgi:hypothetical protein
MRSSKRLATARLRSAPHRLPDGVYDERPCLPIGLAVGVAGHTQRLRWCLRSDQGIKLCRVSIDRIGPAGRALLPASDGIVCWTVIEPLSTASVPHQQAWLSGDYGNDSDDRGGHHRIAQRECRASSKTDQIRARRGQELVFKSDSRGWSRKSTRISPRTRSSPLAPAIRRLSSRQRGRVIARRSAIWHGSHFQHGDQQRFLLLPFQSSRFVRPRTLHSRGARATDRFRYYQRPRSPGRAAARRRGCG